jgi:hypothetical protein
MKKLLASLITSHKNLHPSACARDIYKMLHQGTMGPRHLVLQVNEARAQLWSEYEELDTEKRKEPLTEQVSVDGSVVRVNLRPFKRQGGNLNGLFECVIGSARFMIPNPSLLQTLWEGFKTLNQQLPRFDHREIADLDELFSKEGFVAISHSHRYHRYEQPSYRVVLLDIITKNQFLFA